MSSLENNKMIAEFMGLTYKEEKAAFDDRIIRKVISKGHPDLCVHQDINYHFQLVQLQYNKSWDWIMPVIEKIGNIELKYKNNNETYFSYPRTFGMKDEDGFYMFRFNVGQLHKGYTLIEATHKAVVDFINNLNKQPQE